ncbi:hypothetical protein F4819DRAFT_220384 [Hypoxylon fuscum]|nr:hypothetical protein F4819DRAFT_220384 [Hypoxylon fuscum]
MELTLVAIQTAVVLSISTTLALVAIGLRLWSRQIKRTPLGPNDYLIIIAMVLALGVYSNAMIEVFTGGIGHHVNEIIEDDPELIVLYLKSFTAAQLLWSASNSFVKFSILSLYMVIFPSTKFRYCCRILMAITLAYFISVLAESFALCRPVEFNWYKSIPDGHCENQSLAYIIAGITNLVIDASVVILPMPMLFSLRLSLLKRFGVAGMFSLGGAICILSFLRVLWVVSWDVTDLTYGVGAGTIYSALEPTLGIVNACLPIIKPALIQISTTSGCVRARGAVSNLTRSVATGSKNTNTPSISDNPGHGFEQLEDNIPLTSVRAHIGRDALESGNNIIITRKWEVN